MIKPSVRAFAALSVFALLPLLLVADQLDLAATVSWDRFILRTETRFDLAQAGLRMPGARGQAEQTSDTEFPRLLLPVLYRLQVDSSTNLQDQIRSGGLALADVIGIVEGAQRAASTLSADLKILTTRHTMDLKLLSALLVRHRHTSEPKRVLVPKAAGAYTGIIIYAHEILPLHGTNGSTRAAACFFPKIWDSNMGLIYERNMVDPEVARSRGIVRYGSNLDDRAYEDIVGTRPLRLLATALFGKAATDPIIDSDDALTILSVEENRQLLREGRIVIVLSPESLSGNF